MSDDLPIPPLDPTYYRDSRYYLDHLREMPPPLGQNVIFQMSMQAYHARMLHEQLRLEREQERERMLAEKTEVINKQAQQIKQLHERIAEMQTAKLPSVPALRQAYMEDVITIQEYENLLLYVIAGQS